MPAITCMVAVVPLVLSLSPQFHYGTKTSCILITIMISFIRYYQPLTTLDEVCQHFS